jgi:hypothetical protein
MSWRGLKMNDLTKDELLFLNKTLQWIIINHRELNSTFELQEKIQSLIDNYCEHESNGSKGLSPYTQCRKCGIKYEN